MSQTTLEDVFLKFTGKKIREAEGAGNPMHAMAMMHRRKTPAYLNPLTYGVDGLRHSLIGVGTFSLPMDFVVLAISFAVMLGLGAYFFDIGERSWPFTAGLAGRTIPGYVLRPRLYRLI